MTDLAPVQDLVEALQLEEGQRLERLYLFDRLERGETTFSLAFVVKRVGADRLEMVAIGGRAATDGLPAQDFVRRARFPEPVLSLILAEFIDRSGMEGAMYREVALEGGGSVLEQLAELAGRLASPPDGGNGDEPGPV
ncbi:MAG TPA: hypothetical protein VM737_07385 [Gemmatimonadota bacterium]|nr:hypothetical protein [Gemmatimonadota bacterium]